MLVINWQKKKIKDINEAYKILSQPSTKRKYDRTWNYNVGRLKRAKQKTSGEMAGEFFEMFFGNSDIKEEIPEAKLKAQKGENIETSINISLEDGFFGSEKKIVLKDIEGKSKAITIKVPSGIQNGEKIRVIGQGKEGINGGKNGDLYIKINIEDNKKYKLNGTDLYTIIPITPWDAALGTKTKISSIDDSKTQVYIPNGVQSGETIEIPQKGYKTTDGQRGNLIAQIKIVVPDKLTAEEKEMFKKLKEISKFNPKVV